MNKKQLIIMGLVLALSLPLNVWAATTLGDDLTVGDGTPDVTQDGEDAYIEGTLEVDGAARFDGATAHNGAITVGEDDTGYDVTFYGATSGVNMIWDESEDRIILNNATYRGTDDSDDGIGYVLTGFQDSASPASLDFNLVLRGEGKNSTDENHTYASLMLGINDPSDGGEEGIFAVKLAENTDGAEDFALVLHESDGEINFILGDPTGAGIQDSVIKVKMVQLLVVLLA